MGNPLADRPIDDPAIIALRKRSPEERDAYIANAARAGLIDPGIADRMIIAARQADRAELEASMSRPIGPVDCRGEPLDLGPDDGEEDDSGDGPCSHVFQGVDDHDECMHCGALRHYSLDRPLPVGVGPATSADLLELDAVPEPVDSAAPAATYLPGARPIGPDAETRPHQMSTVKR